MKIPHYILFILLAGAITSCQHTSPTSPLPERDAQGKLYFDSKKDFTKWNDNNDQIQLQREIGDFTFKSKYVSPYLLALQETRGDSLNNKNFAEAVSHYQDLLYFRLNISNVSFNNELLKYNVTGQQEYNNRLEYCAFHMHKDVMLTNGKDTVPCTLHQFERTFNVQSGLNFLVTFPKIKTSKGLTLIYHDHLFNHGLIKFRFPKEISNIPYLKIK